MAFVNPRYAPETVPAPLEDAPAFHRGLPGYAPTPVRSLGDGVFLKDESDRLGLPAFKVLGVSWAVEQALRFDPSVKALVAASAGNHGRAVAHVAAQRGLYCRIMLPARSVAARREAIAAEGADVEIVDGTYEDAVERAQRYAEGPYVVELADVGSAASASAVIDGYATLFAEIGDDSAGGLASLGGLAQGLGLPPRRGSGAFDSAGGLASLGGLAQGLGLPPRRGSGAFDSAGGLASPGGPAHPPRRGSGAFDAVLVPIGVGSLGAAAARWGAATGTAVIGVEPDVAACLTAALRAGRPVKIETPGTAMAGLDCAVVSVAAWDTLRAGITGTVTVSDAQTRAAMRELAARGLAIGDSGAAPLAALHALRADPACAGLREAVKLDRVLLIATEGPTDPVGYAAAVA